MWRLPCWLACCGHCVSCKRFQLPALICPCWYGQEAGRIDWRVGFYYLLEKHGERDEGDGCWYGISRGGIPAVLLCCQLVFTHECLFTHEWELPIYTRMESDRGKPQAQSRIADKTDPLTRMAQQHHHESLPIGIFSPVASAEFRREQSSMELSYSTHE